MTHHGVQGFQPLMQTKIGHCEKGLADPFHWVQQTEGGFCDVPSRDPASAGVLLDFYRNIYWKYTSERDVQKVLTSARVCWGNRCGTGCTRRTAHPPGNQKVPPPQPIWNVRIFGSLAFGASPETSSQGLQSAFLASAGQSMSPQGRWQQQKLQLRYSW